jgi:hypothetical protein
MDNDNKPDEQASATNQDTSASETHKEPLLLEPTGTPDPAPSPAEPVATEPAWKPASELSPEAKAALADTTIPATPDMTAPAAPAPAQRQVSAGLVVLQWLTYAFWGWTLLGLSFLVSMVFLSFIGGHDVGGFTPYGIAATLVLLPISFICDTLYAKREPEHKTGAETLVMVVHAVLFALFGIGALIVSVFSLVQLMVSGLGTKDTLTALLSGLVIAGYYGLTFLRTLNPAKLRKATRWYRFAMLLSVGIFAILGIVGPVAKERSLRNDRLIESSLPSISSKVSSYANKEKKLPENLNQLELDDDAKNLLATNLVTYKKEGLVEKSTTLPGANGNPGFGYEDTQYDSIDEADVYRYQLCVTYKEKSGDSSYSSNPSTDDDGYTDYLYIYDHPAGNVCYKLKTNAYGY